MLDQLESDSTERIGTRGPEVLMPEARAHKRRRRMWIAAWTAVALTVGALIAGLSAAWGGGVSTPGGSQATYGRGLHAAPVLASARLPNSDCPFNMSAYRGFHLRVLGTYLFNRKQASIFGRWGGEPSVGMWKVCYITGPNAFLFEPPPIPHLRVHYDHWALWLFISRGSSVDWGPRDPPSGPYANGRPISVRILKPIN